MTWALTQAHRPTGRPERPKRRTWMLWFDTFLSLAVITAVVALLTNLGLPGGSAQPSITVLVLWLALTLALWVSDVYSRAHRNTAQTVLRIWKVTIIVGSAILVVEALAGSWLRYKVPPISVVVALTMCAAAMSAYRVAIALRRRDPGTAGGTRVIVVGCGTVAKDVVSRLERIAGVEVMGLVDDGPCDSGVIGSTRQLPELCRSLKVQRVIVAFTNTGVEQLLPSLRALPNNVAVDVVPRYFELVGWGARLEDFAGMSLVTLSQGCDPVSRDRIKRTFDVVVASVALLIASPILLTAAALVLVTSGRPVLFRQDRLGRGRTPFRIMKLRTLKVADTTEAATDTTGEAPKLHSDMVAGRTTPIGQFLRRTGIDELPQLLNVLAGDMSLVGPRPFIPEECWTLTGLGERRFDVKPGMTGLWQVSGQHDLSHEELVRLDTYYVDTWRFSTDLRILALTPTRLWQGGGDGIAKLALVPPDLLQRPAAADASPSSVPSAPSVTPVPASVAAVVPAAVPAAVPLQSARTPTSAAQEPAFGPSLEPSPS
ncbi:MAG TPA: exopolysaccharide biosynthesis polyprenyl glycosylphosphotransferase [Acidimicrobiales bacterium]|nr:exopolysaccharide biosynthesis polyprenyl glycosylphosphotransferase [Acidimicrobiales bacterium]